MDSEYVHLENAKGLAAAGYPQEQWPQRIWVWQGDAYALLHREYAFSTYTMRDHDAWAAPTHLAALEWLDDKSGWHWYRTAMGQWGCYKTANDYVMSHTIRTANTPGAIITAILEHREEKV